ncbi:agamous-like MADS-box protein AGL80 [Arabidopsis lyrata subsp. lyrata]|uniref:agamous-like MADS-box protein AGL80 n=1 Tax=Arabidopsis lyrata subsp. lyrata TaxID=81972 RepID=UPI000A29D1F0|nr:agamous-like MADS-box protein AGL80 [Arabidopsis lyrata subsp. lyrata]|eukprot:XP_020871231.1 agamous-like MADS-box protein AGL80 [Arabidopsis lyrata subsp. lyrata]
MTRKKVKLAYIPNDSSRKATFKKRKKGLMKKVHELSTLCGITACAIIYSPYDTSPEVWPSNSGVQRVVSEFRTLPEMDQHKKMVDQESFLKQRIAKATENLRRQRKDNRELEMSEVMFQCLMGNMEMFHLNIVDLNDLGYMIEQYLKDVNRRIEILRNSGMEIGESSSAAAAASEGNRLMPDLVATTAPTTTIYEVGSSSSAANANFFNPIEHQQFRHPAVQHVGLNEQPWNLNLNLNQNHNQNQQQWFMEMMNHPEEMRYPTEQMGFQFMDDNHQNHIHHQQQEHQHHTPGESFNRS